VTKIGADIALEDNHSSLLQERTIASKQLE
jgi:hypothetical protein